MHYPYVRISKVGVSETPTIPTPKKEDYIPGQDNGDVSLPMEYTIEGYLLHDIQVGESVSVDRRIRNRVEARGEFVTSPVTKITEAGFETENSVYILDKL